MIEIAEGLWIAPEHVSLIKATDDDRCVLWTVGQSALEGHVLEYPAGEVAEVINEALEEECGEELDDDEDADQNEE